MFENTGLIQSTSINPQDLDVMRGRLYDNISDLNKNKHLLNPGDYNQLLNYHYYNLNILNNMKLIIQAEVSNVYNTPHKRTPSQIDSIGSYGDNKKVIYKKNGQAILINKNDMNINLKGEWVNQFNEGIMNDQGQPFNLPPSNYWGLPDK
jgi:hypothetical protein